jgi:hypothetical protein
VAPKQLPRLVWSSVFDELALQTPIAPIPMTIPHKFPLSVKNWFLKDAQADHNRYSQLNRFNIPNGRLCFLSDSGAWTEFTGWRRLKKWYKSVELRAVQPNTHSPVEKTHSGPEPRQRPLARAG